MKKNGFTLIELLAAIIVLGIVSLVVFPTIDKTIKNQKRKLYDRQVATILSTGESWAVKNAKLLPDEADQTYLGVNALAAVGLLENDDIKDPRNGNKIEGCVLVEYDTNTNQYDYEFINLADTVNANCNSDNICTVSNDVSSCYCTKHSNNIITSI